MQLHQMHWLVQRSPDIRTPSGSGKTVLITEVSLYPMSLYPDSTVLQKKWLKEHKI